MQKNFKICLRLTFLMVLLAAGSVSAYVLLDPPRTWDSAPTYIVDDRGMASITDSDGGATATVNAIGSSQAWNGAGSGAVINAQKGSVAGWQLGDGVPMLSFDDPVHACSGNCLAATFIGYYQRRTDGSYRIFDADIITNNRFDWTSTSEPGTCSGEFYIEGVHAHETGHGLGLGHTNVSGATMYPSVSSCNNGPASIEQDDKDGLNALYGGSGGEGAPACDLLQKGDACASDSECCSGKCRGKTESKSCK
ncbi:MAG: matrixin family metalloprotease [Gammaproteobacteria bacterium]